MVEAFAEGKDLAVMSYKPDLIFESNERERRRAMSMVSIIGNT